MCVKNWGKINKCREREREAYNEIDDGRDENSFESADVGVGEEAADHREDGGDALPRVDALGGGGGGLAEHLRQVHEQVSSNSVVGKSLRHLHN